METIVLDTSVVIKWFKKKKEEKVKAADEYLKRLLEKKVVVAVPLLLFYEFVNVASFDKTLSRNIWSEIFLNLFSIPFEIYPPDIFLIKETYKLAKQLKITAYDATYLALAARLNTVLITADRELTAKGKELVRKL